MFHYACFRAEFVTLVTFKISSGTLTSRNNADSPPPEPHVDGSVEGGDDDEGEEEVEEVGHQGVTGAGGAEQGGQVQVAHVPSMPKNRKKRKKEIHHPESM